MSGDTNNAEARRQAVLSTVRRSLGVRGDENARKVIVEGRLTNRPKGPIPKRGQLPQVGRVRLFKEMAEAVDATVTQVGTPEEILPEVLAYLRGNNLPASVAHGADPRIAGLDWSKHKVLEHRQGIAEADDLVSLAHAFAGVAESGTLVMASGPDNPVTLGFLPDYAIVVLRTADIAGDYETAFARLRETLGNGLGDTAMPRTLNMVTGPSRTADIEQTLLLGAHGPRSLHIIVVG